MIKTQIQKIDCDWTDIKNECRNTINKEATDKKPSKDFILKLLIAEHSPIRLARIKWRWEQIKSWISVHFSRHWLGWSKWISTQRSDRTGINRDKAPQDAPVNMDIEANAQALINVSRFRLCRQASPETRTYMEDLKETIKKSGQEEIALVMQPNCVYRAGCSEFTTCGYWKSFIKNNPDLDISDIRARYEAADKYFYSRGDNG